MKTINLGKALVYSELILVALAVGFLLVRLLWAAF